MLFSTKKTNPETIPFFQIFFAYTIKAEKPESLRLIIYFLLLVFLALAARAFAMRSAIFFPAFVRRSTLPSAVLFNLFAIS